MRGSSDYLHDGLAASPALTAGHLPLRKGRIGLSFHGKGFDDVKLTALDFRNVQRASGIMIQAQDEGAANRVYGCFVADQPIERTFDALASVSPLQYCVLEEIHGIVSQSLRIIGILPRGSPEIP